MWHAVYDTVTGELKSLGQVVTSPLPLGMTDAPLGETKPADTQMWDEVTRAFVARPVKVLVDRLADLRADVDFRLTYDTLNATRKANIDTGVIRLLGNRRMRSTGGPAALDTGT
jgi:hypothetical protein